MNYELPSSMPGRGVLVSLFAMSGKGAERGAKCTGFLVKGFQKVKAAEPDKAKKYIETSKRKDSLGYDM
jgi:hypothetical protein